MGCVSNTVRLGACAYLLRQFGEQVQSRTYAPSYAHTARLLTAGIGGAVVALFPNFQLGQGPSLPPLAIAFLVGYAVEVFFSFIDSLLAAFTRTGRPATAETATTASRGTVTTTLENPLGTKSTVTVTR
jgi:hypothetical protein